MIGTSMSILWGIISIIALITVYFHFNSKYQNFLLVTLAFVFLFLANPLILQTTLLYVALIFITILLLPHLPDHIQKKLLYFQLIFMTLFFLVTKSIFKNQFIGHSYLTLMYLGFFADILWKRTKPILNIQTLTALTFFPLSPTGPIEKISKFSQQFTVTRIFKFDKIQEALFHITLGLFKLTCISIPLIKFTQHQKYLGQIVFGPYMMAYCFFAFVQLYAEFSGIIDIARGTSLIFGINTSVNFKQPYLAESPLDIWNRWHCTLNQWLKEYIYLPFLLKTKNISLSASATLFIVILWHGFSLNYIYWGLYWLAIIAAYIQLKPILNKTKLNRSVFINRIFMIFLMSLSTICFMISTYGIWPLCKRAFDYQELSQKYNNYISQEIFNSITSILICILFMVILDTVQEQDRFKKRSLFIPLLIIAILGFGQFRGTEFYYLGL